VPACSISVEADNCAAIVLFIPLGLFTIVTLNQLGLGSVTQHSLAFISALVIHAAILLHVKTKAEIASELIIS
jgi:hypothetical protein